MNKKPKKQVIAYLHTHWDREWYRTKEEFNLRLLEVFDEILNELESGSMSAFYFDGQTAALEDYLKFRNEKLDLIKNFIAQKRLFIGPFYVSPDNFLVNGISLVRNLNIGIEYSKTLGEREFLGYLADTFGHSRSIFDILRSFNINHSFVWRGVPKLKSNDFMMNGINTTKLAMGYFMDVLHLDLPIQKKAEILENTLDKISENSLGDLLLPIGADHLAALLDSKNFVKKLNNYLKKYEINLSTPFDYVKKADYTRLSLTGEFLDNSETYILPGVYSSRIPQKAENARLQWELFRIVEPFNFFIASKYFANLNFAAKELIKNHAHDSIYGCSIDEVHKVVQARFDKVKAVTEGVKKRLVRDFASKNAKKPCNNGNLANHKNNIIKNAGVFNFSNFEYSGTATVITDFKLSNAQLTGKYKGFSDEILYDTRQIPVTEQHLPLYEYKIEVKGLPAFSFSPVELVQNKSSLEISETKIANKALELSLGRKNGKITINLIDKIKNLKFEDVLEILAVEDFGDSYNSAPSKKASQYKLLRSKIIRKGSVEAGLRLIFEHNFNLDIFLSNFSQFFEIRAKFNNNKKNYKIQACINLKTPINRTFAEDAFGFIERKHDPDYLLSDNIPVKPKIELKTNSYPMQRWLIAQDFGVITEGLNEYEIYKNHLKITLLRCTARISEPKNSARYVPAGPPIETPDLQCPGKHEFRFALAPNADIHSIYRIADSFYQPVVAILGNFDNFGKKKFLNLPENLLFYGLKPLPGKTFGVFYNISNKNILYKNVTIAPKTIEFIEL